MWERGGGVQRREGIDVSNVIKNEIRGR